MSRFRHALVIGKFYPPHSGHEYLIRAASDAAQEVTTLVMAADCETLSLDLRVAWLKEMLIDRHNIAVVGVTDNVPVDYGSDAIWEAHVAIMKDGVAIAERSRLEPAGPVDVVFSSELYGSELARRFNAIGVCLDQKRSLHPISGTAVRRDPMKYWDRLAEPVREHLCRRIVIVGAESSGKTTLAAALTERLRKRGGVWTRTAWVEEFGREYTLNKLAMARALADASGRQAVGIEDLVWESAEFEVIAREQQRREHRVACASGPILICDTDAFATSIWHERYVGHRSAAVDALVDRGSLPLGYILASFAEVPFEDDGLRDGERIREWMHHEFQTRLNDRAVDRLEVSGTLTRRVAQCLAWIDTKLESAWRFTAPLG